VTERLRVLQQEFQRLEQNPGSSTAPDGASLGRLLSMMKREQTCALQDHERGVGASGMLVDTDSRLRLMAGRVVEELLPTHTAE
jgi:hypothetical protein